MRAGSRSIEQMNKEQGTDEQGSEKKPLRRFLVHLSPSCVQYSLFLVHLFSMFTA
jgi:hypothetical protein